MNEYKKYEPIFGAWYLGRLIGKGSFGKVFEITREEFGVTYRAALKVISVPQDEDDVKARLAAETNPNSVSEYYEEILREIVNENMIMSRLKGNSNIVSYEDHQIIPHEDGIGYDILIRMELLTPLLDRMMVRKLDEVEVLRLGIDICRALEICHKNKIIHRDIKPQNIFISDNGDFKLGDFGIARTIEKTTGGLSKKGTYRYMAPEVFRGDDYGSTVDIYSLGLVLYTLLNGNREPFLPPLPAKVTANDEEEAKRRRFRGEPIPAPSGADTMLSFIVQKACANFPEDRYQTANQMRRDLEAYQRSYASAKDRTVGTINDTVPDDSDTHSLLMEVMASNEEGYAANKDNTTALLSSNKNTVTNKKAASWKEHIMKNKLFFILAGVLLAAVCIYLGREMPPPEKNDEYDEYNMELTYRSDGVKSYWWQQDVYGRYPNEDQIAEGAELPLDEPKNKCVVVTDIFGDDTPEMLLFTAENYGLANLKLFVFDKEDDYSEEIELENNSSIDSGAAPWGDTLFTDNKDKDTKYIIYTGKEAGSFYIASSLKDKLSYYSSVKYEVDDNETLRATEYVVHSYGPSEDGNTIIDKYYVNGAEVSKNEGVEAFDAAAEDFGRLLMLSGNDKENLRVFEKGETEGQYATSYNDAIYCLDRKKNTPISTPPEKPSIPDNEYTVVSKDGVVVREGPGKKYKALDRKELNEEYLGMALEGDKACLKQGSKVISLGIDGDWMEISAGWICITYDGETLVKKSSEL